MNKKLLISLSLCILILFSGCIPARYTKGIDIENYPDKHLPIYKDAVVYEYEENENEIEIKYGTDAKMDEVTEFYQEYFKTEEIMLDDEDADDDEYSAEGFYENFIFVIEAEEANGKYEEKAFTTTVAVEVELLSEEEAKEIEIRRLKKKIIGFWEKISTEDYDSGESSDEIRMAIEFLDDGTFVTYLLNLTIRLPEYTWEITEDGKLKYKDLVGDGMCVSEIVFENRDGQEILILDTNEDIMYLFRRDKDKFMSTIPDITDLVDGD